MSISSLGHRGSCLYFSLCHTPFHHLCSLPGDLAGFAPPLSQVTYTSHQGCHLCSCSCRHAWGFELATSPPFKSPPQASLHLSHSSPPSFLIFWRHVWGLSHQFSLPVSGYTLQPCCTFCTYFTTHHLSIFVTSALELCEPSKLIIWCSNQQYYIYIIYYIL